MSKSVAFIKLNLFKNSAYDYKNAIQNFAVLMFDTFF